MERRSSFVEYDSVGRFRQANSRLAGRAEIAWRSRSASGIEDAARCPSRVKDGW